MDAPNTGEFPMLAATDRNHSRKPASISSSHSPPHIRGSRDRRT